GSLSEDRHRFGWNRRRLRQRLITGRQRLLRTTLGGNSLRGRTLRCKALRNRTLTREVGLSRTAEGGTARARSDRSLGNSHRLRWRGSTGGDHPAAVVNGGQLDHLARCQRCPGGQAVELSHLRPERRVTILTLRDN